MTNLALQAGINACGPNKPFKSIGNAIHSLIIDEDYSVSSQFTGHGIGDVFHRPPWILHHCKARSYSLDKPLILRFGLVNDEPGVMHPGDCFTIEVCALKCHMPHQLTGSR